MPGLKRSPGGGNGNLRWYSHLENPMDRGAWQATVHGVTKSQTRLRMHATDKHSFSLHQLGSSDASMRLKERIMKELRESDYLYFSSDFTFIYDNKNACVCVCINMYLQMCIWYMIFNLTQPLFFYLCHKLQ